MGYMMIIAFLIFIGVVQLTARYNLKPVTASILAVIPSYILIIVLRWISVIGYNLPVAENIFSFADAIILIAQFIVSVFVFNRLAASGDSYEAWFGWTILGVGIVVFGIPYFVMSL